MESNKNSVPAELYSNTRQELDKQLRLVSELESNLEASYREIGDLKLRMIDLEAHAESAVAASTRDISLHQLQLRSAETQKLIVQQENAELRAHLRNEMRTLGILMSIATPHADFSHVDDRETINFTDLIRGKLSC